MISKKVKVVSKSGLHARPANLLIKTAQHYSSVIEIKIENKMFNAKSMLGILTAGVNCGDEIEIVCTGSDEKVACDEIVALIASGMGE